MRKLVSPSKYLQMLWEWICLGKWYVLVILLSGMTVYWLILLPPFSFLGYCKEREARWLGWLLQVIGFLIIAWGYNSDAKQHERLRPLRWIAQFPKPFAGKIVSVSAVSIGLASGSARGMVIHNTANTSTIEERLAALEANAKAYYNETSIQTSELRKTLSELRRDFNDHRNKMSNTVGNLGERIVESVSGRVQLNLFAVVLFIIGISVATLSPELASYFGFEASCSQPLS